MPKNKLILEDCLVALSKIPNESIDMILVDPPYGTTSCKWDSVIPLEPMWEQVNRIIKPNGAILIHSTQPFTSILISSNLKTFRYTWIWDKVIGGGGWLNANKMPLKGFEEVCVFYKKLPTYNPIKEKGKPFVDTRDNQTGERFGREAFDCPGQSNW